MSKVSYSFSDSGDLIISSTDNFILPEKWEELQRSFKYFCKKLDGVYLTIVRRR